MFVDVVFDVVSLWSSFSVCFGTYLGALEKGVSMRVLVVVALALCAFSSQVQAASPKGETQEGKAEAEFKSEQGDLSQQLGINDIPTAGCTCGPVAPSIAPINPPTIPPPGTTSCRQAQICDQFGNCRWQQVCR